MKSLRLRIEDQDDLNVVSAHLQDAVTTVGDFAYEPKRRRFACVVNRFAWETEGTARLGLRRHFRVRAGLHFDDVLAVRSQNIRQDAKDAIVSLLAVRFEPSATPEDPAGTITLDFAGGGTIALDVECLEGHLTDITGPWETRHKPAHDLDA
ncbi:DUF2948 family protein [Pyruvatibacter mobilis]|uniref:DUF2948 family protein n=1 Tax=Pyruvatibacter mobilis TaxID=1712261 RepID=UPI003BA8BF1B